MHDCYTQLHGWIALMIYCSVKGARLTKEYILYEWFYLFEVKTLVKLICCANGQYNGYLWGV